MKSYLLVIPYVVYAGKKKYNAPRSLWELFDHPKLAKEIITADYNLIDLQIMPDDEIKKQQHLGMMQYFLKNIHETDMIQLWQRFLEDFQDLIVLDQERGYIYIKKLIWYTDAKLDEKDYGTFNQLILEHLPKNDGEQIMSTVAENYIQKGRAEGEARGKAEGIVEGKMEIARTMLSMKKPIAEIQTITGLPDIRK
ncbi:MAG UNVERIFIED_CONTAM: Rpn family recombination-promoting nuclease/putative transposase [Rickettsiaceae bacterium]|jgi:predicted transposase YdaD